MIAELLKLKGELLKRVRASLPEGEARAALRDPHSRRPPRPCGLTVHVALGCPLRCAYCYIYDMGFGTEARPYPLSGPQLALALLSNKYFLPGRAGTLVAIGSVSEPFHPAAKAKTLEYIRTMRSLLGNPVQFSTKFYISGREAGELAEADPEVSPLVTIVTLERHRSLEPGAPPPEKRLETIANLRSAGLKPFLFLRPLIPGLAEREAPAILEEAKAAGAVGVVAGSLRVTRGILRRLSEAGVDTREIERRLKVPAGKMKEGVQYDIDVSDVKRAVERKARELGLVFFPSACMANMYSHGMKCWAMVSAGQAGPEGLRAPSSDAVAEALALAGASGKMVNFERGRLVVELRSGDPALAEAYLEREFLACVRVVRPSRFTLSRT